MKAQRGQTALLMTLTLVLTLGGVGLVVDVGQGYYRRIAVQTAAESAAAAGAAAAKTASNWNCGSGVTCQSATACPSTLTPSTNPINAACLYAVKNGYTNGANGGRRTVKIAANTTSSPVTGVSPTYWLQATVSETVPTTFSAILGKTNMTVSASATGGVFSVGTDGGCIYILEPTSTALQMSGGAITSNCGIYLNSNSTSAAIIQSGGSVTVTGGKFLYMINVAGWIHAGGTITPSPVTGTVQTDPFASLPVPDTTGSCVDSGLSLSGGSANLAAGKHCGVVSMSGGTLTLSSGTHVFQNGFSISGGTVTGSGVTLYYMAGSHNMSGANITLTAPTTGTYKGILLFFNRTLTSSVNMSGGGLQLTGAVYAKAATLNISGGTFTNTTFVINKVVGSGGSTATVNGASSTNYTGQTTTVSLIQ